MGVTYYSTCYRVINNISTPWIFYSISLALAPLSWSLFLPQVNNYTWKYLSVSLKCGLFFKHNLKKNKTKQHSYSPTSYPWARTLFYSLRLPELEGGDRPSQNHKNSSGLQRWVVCQPGQEAASVEWMRLQCSYGLKLVHTLEHCCPLFSLLFLFVQFTFFLHSHESFFC